MPKAGEVHDMTDDVLVEHIRTSRQELFGLRFQAATGALEATTRLKLAKREIARLLTVQQDRNSKQKVES